MASLIRNPMQWKIVLVLFLFASSSSLFFFHVLMFKSTLPDRNQQKNSSLIKVAPTVVRWTAERQRLLSKPSHVSKVLLYTYMRGGSTVFSRLFELANQNDSNIVLFEPLDAFYSYYHGFPHFNLPLSLLYHDNLTRRIPSAEELDAMTTFLVNMLSCDVDPQYFEFLVQNHFQVRTVDYKQLVRYCLLPQQPTMKRMIFSDCTFMLRTICSGRVRSRPNFTMAILNRCHDTIVAIKDINPKRVNTWDEVESIRRRVIHSLFGDNNTAIDNQTFFTVSNMKKFIDHHHCILDRYNVTTECWAKYGKPKCAQAKVIAAKVIRASFPLLEPLIQRMPDIRIVYYTRDPRAVAWSRVRNRTGMHHVQNSTDPVSEVHALCIRMRDDIHAWRDLTSRYPGAILNIRYEDYVRDTERVIMKLFQHIGKPSPSHEEITQWRKSIMESKKDGSVFGTVRSNASEGINMWRRFVGENQKEKMNECCKDVLNDLGYTDQ